MSAAPGGIQERGNWKLRAIDRYFGIPLVFLLGMARRRSSRPPENPQTFGFLLTTAIGDTILNSAAIAQIRNRHPGSRLIAFCSAGNMGIAKMVPGLDEIVHVPVTHPLRAIKAVRSHGLMDVWIDFGPWPRINAVFSHFARARFKIGFDAPGQFRHFVYDHGIPHDMGKHEVENYLALLRPLGIEGPALPDIRAGIIEGAASTIVIHVLPGGSRHYLKSWPDSHWVDLIGRLVAEGYDVRLTGSPADRQKLVDLVSRCGTGERIRVVAGQLTLEETGALIRSAALTISVDTGILHLASALGANLVALHGPTSPKRWGALNSNSISLESGLPCSPCVSIGYEKGCGVNRCMQSISPDRVMAAVHSLCNAGARKAGLPHAG